MNPGTLAHNFTSRLQRLDVDKLHKKPANIENCVWKLIRIQENCKKAELLKELKTLNKTFFFTLKVCNNIWDFSI